MNLCTKCILLFLAVLWCCTSPLDGQCDAKLTPRMPPLRHLHWGDIYHKADVMVLGEVAQVSPCDGSISTAQYGFTEPAQHLSVKVAVDKLLYAPNDSEVNVGDTITIDLYSWPLNSDVKVSNARTYPGFPGFLSAGSTGMFFLVYDQGRFRPSYDLVSCMIEVRWNQSTSISDWSYDKTSIALARILLVPPQNVRASGNRYDQLTRYATEIAGRSGVRDVFIDIMSASDSNDFIREMCFYASELEIFGLNACLEGLDGAESIRPRDGLWNGSQVPFSVLRLAAKEQELKLLSETRGSGDLSRWVGQLVLGYSDRQDIALMLLRHPNRSVRRAAESLIWGGRTVP